jgi:hypothetical protein
LRWLKSVCLLRHFMTGLGLNGVVIHRSPLPLAPPETGFGHNLKYKKSQSCDWLFYALMRANLNAGFD